jgi:hypothetical protein
LGRTNPTFRNVLEAVKSRWGDYRRALRRRDQARFDQLFEYADAHADAAGYLNNDDPMEPILVSMLLEQEKRLAELEARIADLEGDTADLEGRIATPEGRNDDRDAAEPDGRGSDPEGQAGGPEDRAGEGAATAADGGDG